MTRPLLSLEQRYRSMQRQRRRSTMTMPQPVDRDRPDVDVAMVMLRPLPAVEICQATTISQDGISLGAGIEAGVTLQLV